MRSSSLTGIRPLYPVVRRAGGVGSVGAPRRCPSSSARRRWTRNERDLTVPTGMCSCSAISACVSPSKCCKRTSSASPGSSAARTRRTSQTSYTCSAEGGRLTSAGSPGSASPHSLPEALPEALPGTLPENLPARLPGSTVVVPVILKPECFGHNVSRTERPCGISSLPNKIRNKLQPRARERRPAGTLIHRTKRIACRGDR